MRDKLLLIYKEIKERGLSASAEEKIQGELNGPLSHDEISEEKSAGGPDLSITNLYDYRDFAALQEMDPPRTPYHSQIRSLDELLERDRQREKDGFPRKIRVGRLIKPGKAGKDKIVIVPSTVEEKLIHDHRFKATAGGGESSGGSGDGEEGEVIGEQKVREEEGSGSGGAGQGKDGAHEMESSAYDLGRILTEQFELPNLRDKGKKRSLSRYTYDLTDKHRGFGQLLDKKATLRKILETNLGLGRLTAPIEDVDPTRFLISPGDKIYRVLSPEKDYDSQALVFFVRDYSGSMGGKPTDLVVSQHVLIYSWLLYQYARQVETRFILHDTEAREVPDFNTYYNSKVAGGTQVSAAYNLVNAIVEKENLAQDYNIYVFHGTDGDDWDTDGREALPALVKMLAYANRVGVTIAERSSSVKGRTEVERYLKRSGLLEKQPDLLRLDTVPEDADESRLIDGIRKLIT